MSEIYAIAVSCIRIYSRRVPDSAYLQFVRRFPCVRCGSSRRVEAAHIGPRGLNRKTSDFTAIPLCFSCHQDGTGALHRIGPEEFQIRHGIEFAALQAMFNRFYFLKTGEYAHGWEVEMERRTAA